MFIDLYLHLHIVYIYIYNVYLYMYAYTHNAYLYMCIYKCSCTLVPNSYTEKISFTKKKKQRHVSSAVIVNLHKLQYFHVRMNISLVIKYLLIYLHIDVHYLQTQN